MQFENLIAVVLAGNDEDPCIFGGVGQESKFFLPFGCELVGDRILRAMDRLSCCKAIYVAAPPASGQQHTFATRRPLHTAPQGTTRTGSLMNALWRAQEEGHYRDGDYVLVVTGDLPLLSSSALERFIAGCREAPDADLYLGMIPAESIPEALRPAYRRDLLPFCGGSYLHSDVYLLRPDAVTPAGYKRFEEIVTIRRSDLNRLHGALRVAITLVRIVGVQGLLAFFRILAALSGRSRRHMYSGYS